MIAAAIFSMAGIIAWQNVKVVNDRVHEVEFAPIAWICWIVAALCAIGVIS